ncbi:hypothetical protein N431DRAFT_27358 [Stipitochalara longipes BDJ]|nr:hypothetical protein N431DRAFT_27358 [Stipitochalara longipes BDJ]
MEATTISSNRVLCFGPAAAFWYTLLFLLTYSAAQLIIQLDRMSIYLNPKRDTPISTLQA